MAYQYTVLIRKSDTEYWADCPDIPGCVASGKTIEEAKAQFADAMQYHLNLVKDKRAGYSLPEPRSCEQVIADELDEYIEAYTARVDEPYMTQ